jgi:penicillin V acylase-like amidase (Ntn superfamily)
MHPESLALEAVQAIKRRSLHPMGLVHPETRTKRTLRASQMCMKTESYIINAYMDPGHKHYCVSGFTKIQVLCMDLDLSK